MKSLVGALILAAIAIVALMALTIPVMRRMADSPVIATPAELGDTLGSASALFSALALLGVVAAVYLQRRELHEQERQVVLQRQQAQEQTRFLEEQSQLMRTQTQLAADTAYAQTCQSLLAMRQESIFQLRQMGRRQEMTGAELLMRTYSDLRERLQRTASSSSSLAASLQPEYAEFRKGRFDLLGSYFRTLKVVMRHIASRTDDKSKTWAGLLRAQLTESERVLVFYEASLHGASGEFATLTYKLRLLDSLPRELLAHATHEALFPGSYGDNAD